MVELDWHKLQGLAADKLKDSGLLYWCDALGLSAFSVVGAQHGLMRGLRYSMPISGGAAGGIGGIGGEGGGGGRGSPSSANACAAGAAKRVV